jgi:ERCC4-type nuclease
MGEGGIIIEGYKYTETELKKLLKSIVILCDTREKDGKNDHILKWFDDNGIKYKKMKLSGGDYSFYLPANEELGIFRDHYYENKITIERKANIDELIGNFATDRNRIEDEFLRYKGNMTLLIEDGSYSDIRAGKYTSKYNAKSAVGTLHSFSIKYGVPFIFLNKEDTGCFIYCSFYYYLRSIIT